MKRKPRRRPKPRADKPTAAAPRQPELRPHRAAAGVAAVTGRAARAASPLATRLSRLAALLIMAGLVGAYVVLRLRAGTAPWPSRQDVGMPVFPAVVGAVLLVISSVTMILAQRLIRSGERWPVRACLSGTIVLGVAAIGCRAIEYHVLNSRGMIPWRVNESTFDHADLHFVRAVRAKLKQHFLQLDGKRKDRPDLFTSEDQKRLALVQQLQTSMVSWTEQEVGHWLDDLQRRRSVIAIMAYQIHPLRRDWEAVKEGVDSERNDLSRARNWFGVMREYCQQKTALIETLPLPERADAGSQGETTGQNSPVTTAHSGIVPPADGGPQRPVGLRPASQEAFERLNAALRSQLEELGAGDWAYAKAVIADAVDLAMFGERSTQIESRLANIDARADFLAVQVDPLVARPVDGGLNAQYRWLRLPVSFPNARAWCESFTRLTSIHALILIAVMMTLAALALTPSNRARARALDQVGLMWHAAVVAGTALFVLFSGA